MQRALVLASLVLVLVTGTSLPVLAEDGGVHQSGGQAARDVQAGSHPPLPVSLDRIRKGVMARTDLLGVPGIRSDLPRFYMEVRATPNVETFLQGFDLVYGPVPYGGFTHQEFLNMVTPKELYSSAGFGAAEVLQAALMSKGLVWLADRTARAARNAARDRDVTAIQAQIRSEVGALEASRAQAAGPPDVATLGWMAGCWKGGTPTHVLEEQWMAPRGGSLFGMSRTVAYAENETGETEAFEFLQIRQDSDGFVYVARPSGLPEASFTLFRGATSAAHEVVFENLAHAFPQRIIYRLQPDGSLYVRHEGMQDGALHGEDYPMARTECR